MATKTEFECDSGLGKLEPALISSLKGWVMLLRSDSTVTQVSVSESDTLISSREVIPFQSVILKKKFSFII